MEDNYEIDIVELEKQRYKAIKKSGKYLEISILVGAENEDLGDGNVRKTPVISTICHDCGAAEIACGYLAVKSVLEKIMEDYPTECMAAEALMQTQSEASFKIDCDDEEE